MAYLGKDLVVCTALRAMLLRLSDGAYTPLFALPEDSPTSLLLQSLPQAHLVLLVVVCPDERLALPLCSSSMHASAAGAAAAIMHHLRGLAGMQSSCMQDQAGILLSIGGRPLHSALSFPSAPGALLSPCLTGHLRSVSLHFGCLQPARAFGKVCDVTPGSSCPEAAQHDAQHHPWLSTVMLWTSVWRVQELVACWESTCWQPVRRACTACTGRLLLWCRRWPSQQMHDPAPDSCCTLLRQPLVPACAWQAFARCADMHGMPPCDDEHSRQEPRPVSSDQTGPVQVWLYKAVAEQDQAQSLLAHGQVDEALAVLYAALDRGQHWAGTGCAQAAVLLMHGEQMLLQCAQKCYARWDCQSISQACCRLVADALG